MTICVRSNCLLKNKDAKEVSVCAASIRHVRTGDNSLLKDEQRMAQKCSVTCDGVEMARV